MPSAAWRGRRMGHSNCVLWFNDRALPARRPAPTSYANLQNRKLLHKFSTLFAPAVIIPTCIFKKHVSQHLILLPNSDTN